MAVSTPRSMSENCASDHSTIFATVQDILQVALVGGGTAATEADTLDKIQAASAIMNDLPLLIILTLYQNQGRKVKDIDFLGWLLPFPYGQGSVGRRLGFPADRDGLGGLAAQIMTLFGFC